MTLTRSFRVILATALILALLNLLSLGQEKKVNKEVSLTRQILNLDGEQISIVRDLYGVPHILAQTNRGAYFGGGYAVAQDRLFQLERFRRDARGQLSEIEGSQAFDRDAEMRIVGYTEPQFQVTFDALREEIKQSYQAYADGINFYIKELVSRGGVPDDFKNVGISEPAAWKVTDSIAIGIMMAKRFGSVGGSEASNARILKTLKAKFGKDAEKVFNDLYYLNDPKASTTVPSDKTTAARQPSSRLSASLLLDHLEDASLRRVVRLSNQLAAHEYAISHNLPTKLGSFSYVVAPSKTVSGSAMLVGCPQMGFSIPQIAHEIHYSAGRLNVIGMGFAGIPGVVIGHNDHVAWSMTSGITDMSDLFGEKLNPQNKNQYLYKGKYRDFETRLEVIKIKGERERRIGVMRSIHGPVIDLDEPHILSANIAYALAVSHAGHEFATFEAVYGFNYATSIQEFARLAGIVYTNQNFLAADVEGNIGYWHAGRPPIRARGCDPRLPVPGTGEFEWSGLVPFSEMPQVINPKQGYLANWNNKPSAAWNNGDFPTWGEAYHVAGIEKMLKTVGLMSFEQMKRVMQDIATRDNDAEYLKPHLMAALEKWAVTGRDDQIRKARAYLQEWDNHRVDGSVATTLFDAWYYQLREVLFGEKFSGIKFLALQLGLPNLYRDLANSSMMLHIFNGSRPDAPLSRDYLDGRDKDQVIIEALSKALERLANERGPQMNLWTFTQSAINLDPLPGIPKTERGTYALAVELTRPLFRSTSVLPPGQSEDRRSPHYGDQRELAAYWRFKELLYKRDQLEKPFQGERPGN